MKRLSSSAAPSFPLFGFRKKLKNALDALKKTRTNAEDARATTTS